MGRYKKLRKNEWCSMITQCREEAGLTQQQAAKAAGLSKNHVYYIENNIVSPTVVTLDALLKVYGYELEIVKCH